MEKGLGTRLRVTEQTCKESCEALKGQKIRTDTGFLPKHGVTCAGLCQLVQDYSVNDFENNVLALADIGKFFKLPVILTTSFEAGPNGPLVPELKRAFPKAPYIARPGQISASSTPKRDSPPGFLESKLKTLIGRVL